MKGLAATWVALLLLIGIQCAAAALLHRPGIAWAAASLMALLVTLRFMRVARASPLSRIFAAAGVFWLLVLLGLGSVDFIARRDTPAPVLTMADSPS